MRCSDGRSGARPGHHCPHRGSASEYRSYADSDNDFFTEKILMTHEEFEASQMRNIKEALFQSTSGEYEDMLRRMKEKYGERLYRDMTDEELRDLEAKEAAFFAAKKQAKPQPEPEMEPIYTSEFKAWFGDWEDDAENASKVVDDDGYPLVVYHWTPKAGFEAFDRERLGKSSWHSTAQLGFFFSSERVANGFTGLDRFYDPPEAAGIYPVYLNMRNPYEISAEDFHDTYLMPEGVEDWRNGDDPVIQKNVALLVEEMEKDGHDGIIIRAAEDPEISDTWEELASPNFIVFSPEQIKSVFNRGTWDGNDSRILFQTAHHGSPYEDANSVIARISPEAAAVMGLPRAGDFVARESDLAPIDQKHGDQFRNMGFADARAFVGHVMEHVDSVYKGTNNTFHFVRQIENNSGRVIAEFEAQYENGRYRVTTAHPVRKDFYKKKQPLWERAQSNHSTGETPSAISGQSGVAKSIATSGADSKPLFSKASPVHVRGGMRKMADGRYVVGLFKRADASTILHETAHFWLEELREAARLEAAPEWVHDAWAKLQAAYGFEGFLDGKNAEGVAAWTGVQERFAREFEAYAREGKAPSWELQSAFNKFRNWLTEIYRTVRKLLGAHGVSEDAREVFDVLLATEEEIALSQRRASENSVMDMLEEEVSPELRDRHARAVQKAYDNASAVIANRRLVEQRKAEKEFRTLAAEAVDANPTYRTLNDLRESGISFDTLKTSISEDIAYKLREKWRGGRGEGKSLFRKGGTLDDLLDVAAQFDEDSVQGLAAALMEMPTRAEAIDAEVQRRLAEWDSGYDAEVEYSSALDEALAIELEALTGKKQASPAQLRRQMEERAGVRKISEVEAEYKALKARLRQDARVARKAFAAGKKEGAESIRGKLAELRETERLRRAALGAAYRAKKERDTIVKRLHREASSKAVNDAYRQQILRILAHWQGLGTAGMVPRDPAKLEPLMEFVGSHVSLFDEPAAFVPDFMAELGGRPAHASELTLEQLREIDRVVRELAHQGRAHGRMLSHRKKVEVAVVGGQCAEQMNKLSEKEFISERAGVMGTLRGALRKGLSSLTSMRFLARALDGFEKHGVNHDAWLHPLQEARSNELLHLRTVNALLEAAMRPIVEKNKKGITGAFRIEGVALPDKVAKIWGGLWDMDKVYSVALNMGNAGNLKALMQGYGWTEQDLRAITSRLTEAEWRSIEQIWEAIDSIYPLLNETVQTLKGVPLTKVEAQPFVVETADGQTITVRGGYYPLIFDTRLNDRSAENIATDELLNGMESVLRHPNPKSGMTKDRQGAKIPPLLSLSVIDRHVRDAVHYATHALPLRDVMMLFRDEKFKDAFVRAAGQENYQQLLPWLRGIARPDGERLDGMLKALDWLARRGTMFALGANMRTALLQLASIGNSWSEVGTENFFHAAGTILQSPVQAIQTIREKSAYMNERARLMDDTLRREYDRMRASGVAGVRFMNVSYALDTVQKAQFALISSLDATVAFPTWLAAYDMAIADGMEESRAVAIADGAVVAAQGGGGPIDTPSVMRHAGVMRMLCPFMSFALADFNRKLETVRGLEEWRRTGNSAITPGVALRDFAFQWIMPVALVSLLVSLGRDGELPEAEDYAWEVAGFLTMGIPILRDMSRMAESRFSDKGFAGGRSPLMFSGVGNLVNGIGHAITAVSEDSDRAAYLAIKELTNATGFALGLGTPQIWRTIEGTEAYFVDDKGGFLAPLLGKPHPRRD